ncbi:hypothetical protein ADIARSV_1985 [Arcticibacter svalbardensis MN12-7]|uniref:YCII-related domain-containing protein n=1 Tax=Arcticibacter svalbardensis MN12-7 TaxID=1150600 RepID=R9GTJ8_9SPHI|nr:YciI family protein [Arcticibacter svalbardensis]EOR94880.1 hypothetical protein ADIARSV_1985 [Arcticibacter svalbardensis MN12-7]
MFIIDLIYKVSAEEVDTFLEAHKKYLQENYDNGNFNVSGRKNPRIGGIILAKGNNRELIDHLISSDPFKINNIAAYQVTEFIPTKFAKEFSFFIS